MARVFQNDREQFGDAKEFPYAGDLVPADRALPFLDQTRSFNAVMQPEFFVEISEQLASEKGIKSGHWVQVWSKRGSVKAKAVVTKRITPLTCDGKPVHIVGIPLHWGFIGETKGGFGPNSLTPFVGDANTDTPEFKAFLVNIKRIDGHQCGCAYEGRGRRGG